MKPGQRLSDVGTVPWIAVGKYFVVEGVSKTLDSLEVKVSGFSIDGALAEVSAVRRQGLLIGDRPWQEAVFPGTLFIPKRCLRLSSQQDEMEFSSKNDFGKHVANGSVTRGNLCLVHTKYENALSVELSDISAPQVRKLVSRVFFDAKQRDTVESLIRSFYNLTTHVQDIERELKGIA